MKMELPIKVSVQRLEHGTPRTPKGAGWLEVSFGEQMFKIGPQRDIPEGPFSVVSAFITVEIQTDELSF